MHHYRGTLFQGDVVRLNPANVYVDFSSAGTEGTADWSGYLVVKTGQDVATGTTYLLKLEDGRTGELRVESVAPDDSERFQANFVGVGPMS
jgi:hypothetical protein